MFKKEDLQVGDLIFTRDKTVNSVYSALGKIKCSWWMISFEVSKGYDDNFNYILAKTREIGKDIDVMAIVRPQTDLDYACSMGKVMWEREGYHWTPPEPEEMTLEEICIILNKRIKIKEKEVN